MTSDVAGLSLQGVTMAGSSITALGAGLALESLSLQGNKPTGTGTTPVYLEVQPSDLRQILHMLRASARFLEEREFKRPPVV